MKQTRIYSFGLLLLLLSGWELAARQMSELVLPAPLVIGRVLLDGLASGYFTSHIMQTGLEILLGLLLGSGLGFAAGMVMGESAFLRRILSPYVIASQAVPKLALAPLFILWFGFGTTSKVVITALICFFPLLENTMSAIQYADQQKLDLFRLMKASRWQTLVHFKIPAGLPGILAGLRVAVVLAVVGAVVGEFIGASQGLGALIIASQGMMDTPLMFASLLLLTAMGMILYQLVVFIEKKWLQPFTKENGK